MITSYNMLAFNDGKHMCNGQRQTCKNPKSETVESEWEREGITMFIVPLGKKTMTDKMRLLKRTQWSLIDSLGKEENGLH